MAKKDAIMRVNDWENQRKGLLYGALIVGTIGLAAGLSLIDVIPMIPGTEETTAAVFGTAMVIEAPILGIRQSIENNANLIRSIMGKSKKGNSVSTKNSNDDCAIIEIVKREEQKNGIKQSAKLTALVAGVAALGIIASNKEESSKILEYISRFKEGFQAAFIASTTAILLSIGAYMKKYFETNLIKSSFDITDNIVWDYRVKNGERGARKKTLLQRIGSIRENLKSKEGE